MKLDKFVNVCFKSVLLVALVLFMITLENQDRALRLQMEATEYYQWLSHTPVIKKGAVVSQLSPRCYEFGMEDPFPLGKSLVLCGNFPTFEKGAKVRVFVRDRQVVGVGKQ